MSTTTTKTAESSVSTTQNTQASQAQNASDSLNATPLSENSRSSIKDTELGYDATYYAMERLRELSEKATPEGMYYISQGIENIVGKATVFDLLKLGNATKADIHALSNEQKKALTDLLEGYEKTLKSTGDAQDDRIQKAGTRELDKIQQTTTDNTKSVASEGKKQLDEIKKLGGVILTPQQLGILPDSRPFLFGIGEMFSCAGLTYTSEFGQLYNNKGKELLDLITGIQAEKRFNKWERPPEMKFIQGDTWHLSEQITKYACSSNKYNYPPFMLSVVFVKNTSDKKITRAFGRRYSCYSSGYTYAGLNVGTPDTAKTKIDWKTISTYTGNTADRADSINVDIPANTTIAIVCYNSAHYATSSNGYQFYYRHMLEKMNSFFGNGLEVDIEATLIAAQKVKINQKEIWGMK